MEIEMTDITVSNHGSIVLLTPVSEIGEGWLEEHIPSDALTWGKNSIVVEPRYVGDIIDGAAADGLAVA
tara:strand:+ start:303 stop:509 length:207 start_codon:yes stop_codon:yes gene_type:complete